MTNDLFDTPDWRLLRYFSIIAEEASMRRAAERLFMTQPPLSRHMKRLEEMLGVTLFTRHSKGLTLTSQGQAVLRIVRPVLQAQDAASKSLQALGQRAAKADAPLVRHSSPQLARAVRQGKLDAALVALPLDAPGLRVSPLPYAEPLLAALPTAWVATKSGRMHLQNMNGRALFWFRREANPAFFDHMRGLFAHVGFTPEYIEEPEEYDVLLARIAQAEGMGLLPRSFSAIGRQGVIFQPLEEDSLLQMRLGLILPASHEDRDTRRENSGSDASPDQLQEILTAAAGHLGG